MKTFIYGSLAFLFLAAPSISRADWQGTVEVQGQTGKEKDDRVETGKIFAQGGKIRFEMKAHDHDMIVITDIKGQSAAMLMPAQKMAMEMPAAKANKDMVTCSTNDVDECLKTKGFKKTGSDTIDGHPCAIYEADGEHNGTKSHQKLWRPTDMKEVFMLKTVTHSEHGEMTMLIKNVKLGKLETALFTVPSDYKKMQMPDMSAMMHQQGH
jgi:outer membrane lipoprotein-sorting protein